MNKKWWTSKTLWVNFVGLVAIVAQGQFGFVIDAETQVGALAVINFILRTITTGAVGK